MEFGVAYGVLMFKFSTKVHRKYNCSTQYKRGCTGVNFLDKPTQGMNKSQESIALFLRLGHLKSPRLWPGKLYESSGSQPVPIFTAGYGSLPERKGRSWEHRVNFPLLTRPCAIGPWRFSRYGQCRRQLSPVT